MNVWCLLLNFLYSVLCILFNKKFYLRYLAQWTTSTSHSWRLLYTYFRSDIDSVMISYRVKLLLLIVESCWICRKLFYQLIYQELFSMSKFIFSYKNIECRQDKKKMPIFCDIRSNDRACCINLISVELNISNSWSGNFESFLLWKYFSQATRNIIQILTVPPSVCY